MTWLFWIALGCVAIAVAIAVLKRLAILAMSFIAAWFFGAL